MTDAPPASIEVKPAPPAPHLFLSTLVGGGKMFAQQTQCCEGLRTLFAPLGIGLTIHRNGGTGTDRARNREVAMMLESTATHHLQLDDDVLFDPADILRMMRSDLDVVSMVYPRKEIDWGQVQEAVMRGVPKDELENYASSFIYNPLPPNPDGSFDGREIEGIGAFLAVRHVGTGCLMVKRSVYERYIAHYGHEIAYRTNYPPMLAKHHLVFGCEIDSDSPRAKAKAALLEAALLPERSGDLAELAGAYAGACADDSTLGLYDTEDWSFCSRWRAMGGIIYVFIDGTLTHLGSYAYKGNIRQVMNLREQVAEAPRPKPFEDDPAAMVTIPRRSLWSVVEVAEEYDLWHLPDYDAPRVLDIGANVGIFAIRAKTRWPGASITCYEPNPETFALLAQNTMGLTDDRSCLAIGTAAGQATLYDGRNPLCCSLLDRSSEGETRATGQTVGVMDAADLAACDVLKVDIEGLEVDVLTRYPHLGAVKALLVETHKQEDQAKVRALAMAAGLTRELPIRQTTLRFLRPDKPAPAMVETPLATNAPMDGDDQPIDAHEIVPGLWMGSRPPMGHALARAGFRRVFLCAAEHQPRNAHVGVQEYMLPFQDAMQLDTNKLEEIIDASADIAAAVKDGEKVLVTCNGGRNRSGLVVALAIHAMTGMGGKRIKALIRERRPMSPACLSNQLFTNILEGVKEITSTRTCVVCGQSPAPHLYDHGDDGPYCSEHATKLGEASAPAE